MGNTGLMVLRHNIGLNDIFSSSEPTGSPTSDITTDCVCELNIVPWCCDGVDFENSCEAECHGYNVTASCEQEECAEYNVTASAEDEPDNVGQRKVLAAVVVSFLFVA